MLGLVVEAGAKATMEFVDRSRDWTSAEGASTRRQKLDMQVQKLEGHNLLYSTTIWWDHERINFSRNIFS